MTPNSIEELARSCFLELGYTTVYQETGTLAFYPKDLERMIKKVAEKLSAHGESMRREALEEAQKATCKYCDLQRPLIGNTHTWQVLTSKNKKGKFIYNPVQEECLATAIRTRLTQ